MSTETELKFHVAPAKLSDVAALRVGGAHRGDQSRQQLVSTYFDTSKRKLRRHGLTLRVRAVDNAYLQTVKTASSGSLGRDEWETEIDGARPDLAKLDDTPLDDIATRKLPRKLKPIFQTSVHRITQAIRFRRSTIELAVDRGKLSAGQRSLPITEFELELKSGRAADLFQIARKFEHAIGAEIDLRSKSEKGYQLAAGDGGGARYAEPIELDHALSPSEAFRVIAHATLRHFATNADAVRARDAEAIHQMRVGLRRLRAAISLFDDVLPRAATARIKAELKWLTGELAPAREIDVFLKERIHSVTGEEVPKRGARAIETRFARQRAAAFGRAKQAVGSARFRRLLIDVLEWIEARRPPRGQERSISDHVASLFHQRIRKAHKLGKQLDELSPRQRHKLRIRIKKIRYAVSFFESLYAKRDRADLERLAQRLKTIQSALGSLNDFMAHREMAADAALSAPRTNRRAQAFASGFVVGREHEAARGLMKAASDELRKLHPLTVEPR